MAFLVPFAPIIGAAVLGGGATAAAMGAFGGDKPQEPQAPAPAPALEAAPNPADAQAVAQAEVEKKKRIRALAGGKTILTDAAPTLGGGGKTLLGS